MMDFLLENCLSIKKLFVILQPEMYSFDKDWKNNKQYNNN